MNTHLAALIFDVDGTLAETEEAHRLAFNRAFTEFDLPWSWDRPLYKELLRVAGGKERIRAFALRYDAGRIDDKFDELVAALHRRKTERYTGSVAGGSVPLRDGIAELIGEARTEGLKVSVATTTSRANVDALLHGATAGEGRGWFEVLACAEDAPVKKPDPQVYLAVVERLGIPATACLAIEDSANGVRAACAAGVPVIAVRSAFTDTDDVSGALAVFSDLQGIGLSHLRSLHEGRE